MVASAKTPYVTPKHYLEIEQASEGKSEYFDGVIVAMSGVSPEHDRAKSDISASINTQLRGKPCEPFTSNMRVHIPACNRYV